MPDEPKHVGYLVGCVCRYCTDHPMRKLVAACAILVEQFDLGNLELGHLEGCSEDRDCGCPSIDAFNEMARQIGG